jgi:hypothetical protein
VAADVVTVESLATGFGIRPDQVPSFLSLTEAGSGESLSRKQAVRLLEVHGTLHGIFANPSAVAAPPKIKTYLIANKVALLGRSAELTIKNGGSNAVPACELVRDNYRSKRKLKEWGFPSLSRLLARPNRVDLIPKVNGLRPAYVAVVDQAGLCDVTKAISSAEVCAIDTESSGQGPEKSVSVWNRILGLRRPCILCADNTGRSPRDLDGFGSKRIAKTVGKAREGRRAQFEIRLRFAEAVRDSHRSSVFRYDVSRARMLWRLGLF